MRKIVAILLVLVMVIGLVACAADPPPPTPTPAPTPTPEQVTNDVVNGLEDENGEINLSFVGIIMPDMRHQFFVDIVAELTEVLEAEGIRVDASSSDGNAALQLEFAENYRQMGVDGLIVFPPSGAEGLGEVLQSLRDEGVRVVSFINRLPAGYDVQVLTDDFEQGLLSARAAAEWIDATFPDAAPGSIEVGLLTIRVSPEANAQSDGLAAITEYTDKVTIVAEIESTFADGEAVVMANTETLLTSHPNISVILTYNHGSAVDEVVMRTPGVDLENFAIFAIALDDPISQRVALSRTNESVVRGVATAGRLGRFYHVAEAMLGRIEADANGIYWNDLIMVDANNVDQVRRDAGWD